MQWGSFIYCQQMLKDRQRDQHRQAELNRQWSNASHHLHQGTSANQRKTVSVFGILSAVLLTLSIFLA